MTIILQEHPRLTKVTRGEPAEPRLRKDMRFAHALLPRTLDEDRRFVACFSGGDWNGVRLGGIESPADIEKASTLLRVAEGNRAMDGDTSPDALLILAVLDTARAALALHTFDRTIPRLAGFIFDADALANASGAAADSTLVADLRLRLPLAARASGVTAFLSASNGSDETETIAAQDGYGGLCIKRA